MKKIITAAVLGIFLLTSNAYAATTTYWTATIEKVLSRSDGNMSIVVQNPHSPSQTGLTWTCGDFLRFDKYWNGDNMLAVVIERFLKLATAALLAKKTVRLRIDNDNGSCYVTQIMLEANPT